MRLLFFLIMLPALSWGQTQVITLNPVPQSSNSAFVPTPVGHTYQSFRVNVFDYSETSYKSYDILVGQWNQAGNNPVFQQMVVPREGVFNYTPSLSSDLNRFKTFLNDTKDDTENPD